MFVMDTAAMYEDNIDPFLVKKNCQQYETENSRYKLEYLSSTHLTVNKTEQHTFVDTHFH